MSDFNCNCKTTCTGLALIISVIIGVAVTVLRLTAVITVTPAFLWVVLGIATAFLLLSMPVAAFSRKTGAECCGKLSHLLVGALGSILASVILLAFDFVATSIAGALITGALALFFAYTLTTAACYIKCLAACD